MDNKQYNALFSFIWNIANDVLVHAFEKGDYKKIILPFMVLRRIDVLLEPTKAAVLEKKDFCDSHHLADYTPFLTQVTGYPFYNTSAFTMKTLKNEIDPQRLKMNIIEYFNGFSQDVQDIIDKFKLRQQVDNLTEAGRLGSLLEKFTDENINLSVKPVMQEVTKEDGTKEMIERLPGLDNHTMGTIFEELLRKFNEENNVTEAGEHFTPRDYVRLLGQLAVEPIKDMITDNTYTIYDGACGTGGILTIAQEEIERIAKEEGKRVRTSIFGQELQPDTYATCKADLMISGNINKFSYRLGTVDHQYIAFGSTISQDGHAGEKFDFCISNPPFGTPWKEDLKNWGISDKKEITDPRFFDGVTSFIPDISDCQMLFLANNISRMKDTPLGTRIVEVHNESSLFNGSAGSGPSNLRKYIIENDLLEAIVAMPEKCFYNTGITTYIWVLTNRKEDRRKGYVQLIDATNICTPLKKNLGEKNCETTDSDIAKILNLLKEFKECPESKIFKNEEFGYWQVPVLRPKKNDNGEIILKKGKPIMTKSRTEFEQVPLLYPGGINAYLVNEVKPFDPEVEFDEPTIGYDICFTKYFYKPVILRTSDQILDDIKKISDEINILNNEISITMSKGLNNNVKYVETGVFWQPTMPEHWEVKKLRYVLTRLQRNREPNSDLLICSNSGKVNKRGDNKLGLVANDDNIYQGVKAGDLLIHGMDTWHGAIAISNYDGMCTPVVHVCDTDQNKEFIAYYLRNMAVGKVFKIISNGVRQNTSDFRCWDKLAVIPIVLPPKEEQDQIVDFINRKRATIEMLSIKLQQEVEHLKEYNQRIVFDLVTGQNKLN